MSFLPTVYEARNILGDPAYNFRWTVILPVDVYSGIESGFSIQSGGISFSTQGLLNVPVVPRGRVESVQLPGITIDADGRFSAASKLHYARWIEVEACQLTMYEDMNYNSLMYFKSWQNMVVDNYHNYYPAYYYKRTIYFLAFDPVYSDSPTLVVELRGAWPTNPGSGLSYEYNSAGMLTLPVNLSVDNIVYHFSQNKNQYA